MRWYFLSGPFWSCKKETVGLPGRGGSPLLFAFRMAPIKRKYIGQVNPNFKGMKLLRAGPYK
jgi:hypothetical protein